MYTTILCGLDFRLHFYRFDHSRVHCLRFRLIPSTRTYHHSSVISDVHVPWYHLCNLSPTINTFPFLYLYECLCIFHLYLARHPNNFWNYHSGTILLSPFFDDLDSLVHGAKQPRAKLNPLKKGHLQKARSGGINSQWISLRSRTTTPYGLSWFVGDMACRCKCPTV